MNIITKSEFQQKYPLSSKKLAKKMFSVWVGGFFLSALLPIFFVPMYLAITGSTAPLSYGGSLIVYWFFVLYFIYIILYRLYWKNYINRYFYDCNNGFVTIKKGVFMPTEIHVQYQKIQDVYVDQDLLDRIMGLYDVHIASATATSGIEAHIDGVNAETAEGLKNFLLNSIRDGGVNFNSSSMPQTPVAQPQPEKIEFNLPENISSETYPINSNWMILKGINSIFASLFMVLFIFYFFFISGKNGAPSLLDQMNIPLSSAGGYVMIIFALIFLFNLLKAYIWKKNYNFKLVTEYIFVRQGIISIQEQHIPYDRIQDVIVNQGFFERLIGLASVYVQNAAVNSMPMRSSVSFLGSRRAASATPNGIVIPGQKLSDANKLSEIIRSVLHVKNQQTGL